MQVLYAECLQNLESAAGWNLKGADLAVHALPFYFSPAVLCRWFGSLISVFLQVLCICLVTWKCVKLFHIYYKGVRFLEPRGWLHNRNCPQISFHQEVVPGLSIQNVLNHTCTFLSRQLRMGSLHLRKWKEKNIGCYQRKEIY